MSNITPQDMMALQTDNFDAGAAMAMPFIIANMKESDLNVSEKKYVDILKAWDCRDEAGTAGPTVFDIFWKNFEHAVYDDEYAKAPKVIMRPFWSNLVDGILKDSAYKFLDNISTPQTETLSDIVTGALKKAAAELQQVEATGKLNWEKHKGTAIKHLAKLVPFSRMDLVTGGGGRAINATKSDHGPSWRMVISLTAETEAWGVYPGGQNGNIGSKYYDSFVDHWAAGKYYPLWMMTKEQTGDKRILAKMSFNK